MADGPGEAALTIAAVWRTLVWRMAPWVLWYRPQAGDSAAHKRLWRPAFSAVFDRAPADGGSAHNDAVLASMHGVMQTSLPGHEAGETAADMMLSRLAGRALVGYVVQALRVVVVWAS